MRFSLPKVISIIGTSFLFCIAILSSCSSSPQLAAGTGKVAVFYQSNRQGEIEPCGCQVHQLGGFNRLAVFLAESRKGLGSKSQVFVDAGDTFFSVVSLNAQRKEQEKLRAGVLADAFRILKLDAFGPGERDFAEGIDFLKGLEQRSGAVFVASNLKDAKGQKIFQRSHLFTAGGQTVGVFSLVSREAMAKVPGITVEVPEEVYSSVVSELRTAGAKVVILLSHLGLEKDREFAKKGGVDLIVGSHSLDSIQKPEVYGTTAVVQTLYQGQQVGRIDIAPGPAEQWASLLVDMEDAFDKPSEVTALIQDYRSTIRSRGLSPIDLVQAPLPKGASFVANANTCRSCHRAQYDFWAKTNHAGASLVLYSKNQIFDPECIACHSLGFESPGGFEKIARPYVVKAGTIEKKGTSFVEEVMKQVFEKTSEVKPLDSRDQPARYAQLHKRYVSSIQKMEAQGKVTQWFLDVQCEHCHGDRSGHPGNGATVKKVQESTCRTCHAPPNAPSFNTAMIKKVACPLMKR